MLSLPTELVPVLRELSGSHWVRDRLREVVAEREKKEKQNQQVQKKEVPQEQLSPWGFSFTMYLKKKPAG